MEIRYKYVGVYERAHMFAPKSGHGEREVIAWLVEQFGAPSPLSRWSRLHPHWLTPVERARLSPGPGDLFKIYEDDDAFAFRMRWC